MSISASGKTFNSSLSTLSTPRPVPKEAASRNNHPLGLISHCALPKNGLFTWTLWVTQHLRPTHVVPSLAAFTAPSLTQALTLPSPQTCALSFLGSQTVISKILLVSNCFLNTFFIFLQPIQVVLPSFSFLSCRLHILSLEAGEISLILPAASRPLLYPLKELQCIRSTCHRAPPHPTPSFCVTYAPPPHVPHLLRILAPGFQSFHCHLCHYFQYSEYPHR